MNFLLSCSVILMLVGCGVRVSSADEVSIVGYWQNIADEDHYLGCEEHFMIQSLPDGQYRSLPVKSYDKARILIPVLGPAFGKGRSVSYWFEGEELLVVRDYLLEADRSNKEGFHRFRRLRDRPEELVLRPLVVGKGAAVRLSTDEVREISEELSRRMERDQQARKGVYGKEGIAAQVADHGWLCELVARVGWIDMGRFDERAALAAFLIAQHSFDMRLRLAAQWGLAEDIRRGRPAGGLYTILYDRNTLFTKGIQRFGTHFYLTSDEVIHFLPIENRSKLERLRTKARLQSFKSVLDGLMVAYPGFEIRYIDSIFED